MYPSHVLIRQLTAELTNVNPNSEPVKAKTERTVTTISKLNLTWNHRFTVKVNIIPRTCHPCGGRIKFSIKIVKCSNCGAVSHQHCHARLPKPCCPTGKTFVVNSFKNWQLQVPAILLQCVYSLETNVNTTDVFYDLQELCYQMPTYEAKAVDRICKRLETGKIVNLNVHPSLLADCICRYLEDNSPIPTWHLDGFIKVMSNSEKLMRAVLELPVSNRHTLAFIILHFNWMLLQKPSSRIALMHTFARVMVEGECPLLAAFANLPETFWLQSFHVSSVRKARSMQTLMTIP